MVAHPKGVPTSRPMRYNAAHQHDVAGSTFQLRMLPSVPRGGGNSNASAHHTVKEPRSPPRWGGGGSIIIRDCVAFPTVPLLFLCRSRQEVVSPSYQVPSPLRDTQHDDDFPGIN